MAIKPITKKRFYTEKHKYLVIDLIKLNINDLEIIEKTGYCSSFVRRISTEYWQSKMGVKKDPEEILNDECLTPRQVKLIDLIINDTSAGDIMHLHGFGRAYYREIDKLKIMFDCETIPTIIYKYLTRM